VVFHFDPDFQFVVFDKSCAASTVSALNRVVGIVGPVLAGDKGPESPEVLKRRLKGLHSNRLDMSVLLKDRDKLAAVSGIQPQRRSNEDNGTEVIHLDSKVDVIPALCAVYDGHGLSFVEGEVAVDTLAEADDGRPAIFLVACGR